MLKSSQNQIQVASPEGQGYAGRGDLSVQGSGAPSRY